MYIYRSSIKNEIVVGSKKIAGPGWKIGTFFIAVILCCILFLKLLTKPNKSDENLTFQKDYGRELYYQTIIISSSSPDLSRKWQVINPVKENFVDAPTIQGESGIIVDQESRTVLFSKNLDKKLKLASLIKIMTAVITLEHKSTSAFVTVSEEAASVGENAMGISSGEVYTVEELLYGMLLNSGNDAAHALAEGVAGDVPTFVKWMNIKASELGLSNSYFADPAGLDDSSYTTVSDLAILTEYAMRFEDFRKIVKTISLELPYSDSHKYLYLENQTNLLTTYPGVVGVKTGYTEEAGLCLVTYASNGGKDLIGVVLNSPDRKGDMILMLDYGFNSLGIKVVHELLN